MVAVESFPLGSRFIQLAEPHLFIHTSEGAIYDLQILLNSIQQKSIFGNLHLGPITGMETMQINAK